MNISRQQVASIIDSCPIKGQDGTLIKAIRYMSMGYPVLFYGPSGNGKTTVAEHLLSALGGKRGFLFIEATEGMTEYQLVGGFHPLALAGGKTVFKDGVVARALKERKNLLIDEFTRAPTSAYSGLFKLLSHGNISLEHEEVVLEKFDGFLIAATANIGDEGTFKISTALKRRFVPIYVDYPPRDIERSVLTSRTDLRDEDALEAILSFADETRRVAREEKTLPQGLSPDSAIKMAKYISLALSQGSGLETSFLDAAFQSAMVIADEQDELSVTSVKEIALEVARNIIK